STPPTRTSLFKSSQLWHPSSVKCSAEQASIIKRLEILPVAAILEKNTRQQAESQQWRDARLHRVT
ncbi:unnamed protein product, partial [Ixodes persulcatus]